VPVEEPVGRLGYQLEGMREESRRLMPMALLFPPGIVVLIGLFVPVFQASGSLLDDSGDESLPGRTLFEMVGNPADQEDAAWVQALALTAALLSVTLVVTLITTGLSEVSARRRGGAIAAEVAAIALALVLVLLSFVITNPEGGYIGGLGYTMGGRWLPSIAVLIWTAIAAHRVREID